MAFKKLTVSGLRGLIFSVAQQPVSSRAAELITPRRLFGQVPSRARRKPPYNESQAPHSGCEVEITESLLDRLINTSHQVLMDGPSYRPRKRPGRPTS